MPPLSVEEAFKFTHKKHSGLLHAYFRKRLGYDLAGDSVQDVFVKVLEHLKKKPVEVMKVIETPWIMKVAEHHYLNILRKGKFKFVPIEHTEELASSENVEQSVIDQSTYNSILDTVKKRFTPMEFAIFYKYHYEQATVRQLAEELGLNKTSVGEILAKKTKEIRELLELEMPKNNEVPN